MPTTLAVAQTAASLAHDLTGDQRFDAWFTGRAPDGLYTTRQDSFGGYAGLYVHLADVAELVEEAVEEAGGWHETEEHAGFDLYLTSGAVADAILRDEVLTSRSDVRSLLVSQ